MQANQNLAAVIQAYSKGQALEKYGNPKWALGEPERLLVETWQPNRSASILTAGCGAGRETFALYRMGYPNVTGLDCTETLLELARRHNAKKGTNLEFTHGTLEKMPFEDNRFDLATLFENVYGHITPRAARRQSLTEIRRVLKPEGLLFLICNSLYHLWRYGVFIRMMDCFRLFYNPLRMEKGDRLWGKERQTSNDKTAHVKIHWFTRREVEDDAAAVGLKVALASSVAAVSREPAHTCRKTHNQGWLVYVLQKPAS